MWKSTRLAAARFAALPSRVAVLPSRVAALPSRIAALPSWVAALPSRVARFPHGLPRFPRWLGLGALKLLQNRDRLSHSLTGTRSARFGLVSQPLSEFELLVGEGFLTMQAPEDLLNSLSTRQERAIRGRCNSTL